MSGPRRWYFLIKAAARQTAYAFGLWLILFCPAASSSARGRPRCIFSVAALQNRYTVASVDEFICPDASGSARQSASPANLFRTAWLKHSLTTSILTLVPQGLHQQ